MDSVQCLRLWQRFRVKRIDIHMNITLTPVNISLTSSQCICICCNYEIKGRRCPWITFEIQEFERSSAVLSIILRLGRSTSIEVLAMEMHPETEFSNNRNGCNIPTTLSTEKKWKLLLE